MDGGPRSGTGSAAATRLHDLAVAYAARAHQVHANLIHDFEIQAAGLMPAIGDLVVEDGDDQRLSLTASGRFRGEVVVSHGETDAFSEPPAAWEAVTTPDDVVDFYDPVDLFDDLTDAIEEAFPETAGADARTGVSAPAPIPDAGPWFARQAATGAPAPDPAPLESASMTILRDLHAAGAYTDEEFARRKAELEKR